MNDIKRYYVNGNEVRVVLIDGEPWFVAKDVAEHLGYTWNGQSRIEHVPAKWRGVTSVGTPYGGQDMAVLSEPGLYFFLARSDKPLAVPFQEWIAGEVLPSIRKTGSYGVPVGLPDFTDPAIAARAWADQFEGRSRAEEEVKLLAPLAAVADRIAGASGLRLLSEIGKINGIGPRRIFELCAARGFIYRKRGEWVPYQEMVDRKLMVSKERAIDFGDSEEHLRTQLYVTGKGEVWLAQQLFPLQHALSAEFMRGRVG